MSSKKRRASDPKPPPAKKLKLTVTAEAAATQDKFELIRSLDRNLLKPETIAQLSKHKYDPLQKDPQVKVVIRSGGLSSKCELVRSDGQRPFKIVASADIRKGECVAVYMGRIVEADRCTEINIWQYNIPSTIFPKKNGIPSLVLDGSRSANECRFFHAAEWYQNKAANVTHFIVWDVLTHLPQVIYRTTRNVVAGEDLLLEWGTSSNAFNKNSENSNNNENNNEKSNENEEKNDNEAREKEQVELKKKQAKQLAEKKKQEELAKMKQKKEEAAKQKQIEEKKRQEEDKRQEEARKKRKEVEEEKKQSEEKKRKDQKAADRAKKDADQTEEIESPAQEDQVMEEDARKQRELEIMKAKQILEEALQEERIERISKMLEEKNRQGDQNKPKRTINYGTTKVTKKTRSEDTSIESDKTENNGEELPTEVEKLQSTTNGRNYPKPTVEIDFFSQKETTSNNYPRDSNLSPTINMNDVTFDLNDSLALSEEEEELETIVI
jgi:hypothetical protein